MRKSNGRRHQGACDVGHGKRLICSNHAQAVRTLLAGVSARNFSAQRHDSVLIVACQLRQLDRLAFVEHLPDYSVSACCLLVMSQSRDSASCMMPCTCPSTTQDGEFVCQTALGGGMAPMMIHL